MSDQHTYERDVPDGALEKIAHDPRLSELIAEALEGWHPTGPVDDLVETGPAARREAPRQETPYGSPYALEGRWQPGLAASSGSAEILVDAPGPAGLRVTRTVFADMGLVEIVVETSRSYRETRFPVLGLYHSSGTGTRPSLLFLLVPGGSADATGRSEVRLPLESSLVSDELVIYDQPLDATDLPDVLLPVVARTVAVATLPWKEAWRRVAVSTPLDDPLRAAVSEGLARAQDER